VEHAFAVQDRSARSIEALLETRKRGNSIFPSAMSMTIAPGSYFVRMPTQDGRHAMVIFPPGPQSLDDIQCMCGVGDSVQFLRRVVISETGGGKCLLQS
jgi:hypothetical protein